VCPSLREEHLAAASAAAERPFAGARRIGNHLRALQHAARLVIDVAVPAQVTGIVKYDTAAEACAAGSRVPNRASSSL